MNREDNTETVTHPFLFIKNLLDIFLGSLCLLLLIPLLVLISIAIKIDSKGPVFFMQRRVGRNSVQFDVFKFRTMVDNAENIGTGLTMVDDDPRITTVGKILRDWSLDEIPQIINIVRGEMSFIGPRPTLQYQVDNYTSQQLKRLQMKPGVTGWAQVNGRNNIPWDERIELDIWYVEHWSPGLDMKILFRTPKVVFTRENVYSDKGVSYDFHGTEKNKSS